MHSLVFRHAYTANKQRTMRARADKQAFDVADELPVPPDVEAAVTTAIKWKKFYWFFGVGSRSG